MFKNLMIWILNNVFHIQTQTTTKEITDNQKYANVYEEIDSINFNAIFSNKLANYTINDSNMDIIGDNKRVELLDKMGQSMWKKAKKIVSMGLGYGGVVIVPYAKGGKLYYDLVPQNRLTIDELDGEAIKGATILAEKRKIQSGNGTKTYIRWTNYQINNGNLTILQQYSDDKGKKIEAPDFWKNITESITISGVEKVTFGYFKSPVNNRCSNDKYGVPITFGCDDTISEIKETLKQIAREYDLKQVFVGVDMTMFGKDGKLPSDGLFKKFDMGSDEDFFVYDPSFRPYKDRLQELYKRLEHEIGTSGGIVSEVETANATATEIKKSMYDTFSLVDDIRTNVEQAMYDFFDACDVIANAYNLTPAGDYEVKFNWSYSLLEDSETEFNHMVLGESKGIIDKVELRQWIKPDESLEEAEKKIEEIKEKNPSVKDLLGTDEEE